MTGDTLQKQAHEVFKEVECDSLQMNTFECGGRSPLNAELSETAYVTREDVSTNGV